jgi:hypothetical protein
MNELLKSGSDLEIRLDGVLGWPELFAESEVSVSFVRVYLWRVANYGTAYRYDFVGEGRLEGDSGSGMMKAASNWNRMSFTVFESREEMIADGN